MIAAPNEGKLIMAERILGKKHNGFHDAAGNLVLRLFKEAITVTSATTFADFREADYTGYAAKTLAASSWTVAALNSANVAVATYPAQTFEPTGTATTNTLHGYYITTSELLGEDKVVCSETFASPKTTPSTPPPEPQRWYVSVAPQIKIGVAAAARHPLATEGRTRLLDRLTGKGDNRLPLYIRLWKNNVTPTAATVLADLISANFPGYAQATVAYTDWKIAVASSVANFAQISMVNPITWTFTSGLPSNVIYGYAVHDGTKLLWYERFERPTAINHENPVFFLQGRMALST